MHIKLLAFLLVVLSLTIISCSKKHQPQTEITVTDMPENTKTVAKKKTVRKVIHTPVPKVITVDDRAAQKSVDGRLYYDLEGNRYWKNFTDGRYYKFRQGLFDDPAFKPH